MLTSINELARNTLGNADNNLQDTTYYLCRCLVHRDLIYDDAYLVIIPALIKSISRC